MSFPPRNETSGYQYIIDIDFLHRIIPCAVGGAGQEAFAGKRRKKED